MGVLVTKPVQGLWFGPRKRCRPSAFALAVGQYHSLGDTVMGCSWDGLYDGLDMDDAH